MQPQPQVRRYASLDEQSWLRCRVLGFLDSNYYDDVKTSKTRLAQGSVELVAVEGGQVIALLDVEVEGAQATIDTIACHPDHRRRGLAAALLEDALAAPELADVRSIDAWTREDEAANAWYARLGFVEQFRYVHVYAVNDQLPPVAGLPVIQAFLHAPAEQEERLRETYARLYTCRQYVREL